jgi:hypothetical protein
MHPGFPRKDDVCQVCDVPYLIVTLEVSFMTYDRDITGAGASASRRIIVDEICSPHDPTDSPLTSESGRICHTRNTRLRAFVHHFRA